LFFIFIGQQKTSFIVRIYGGSCKLKIYTYISIIYCLRMEKTGENNILSMSLSQN
jgi:hypothetical protein